MTTAAEVLATLWSLIFLSWVAVIVVDCWLACTGRKTISRWTLETSRRWPFVVYGVLLLLTNALSMAIGALLGHLLFGQVINP